jgi:hypothetical protein
VVREKRGNFFDQKSQLRKDNKMIFLLKYCNYLIAAVVSCDEKLILKITGKELGTR